MSKQKVVAANVLFSTGSRRVRIPFFFFYKKEYSLLFSGFKVVISPWEGKESILTSFILRTTVKLVLVAQAWEIEAEVSQVQSLPR